MVEYFIPKSKTISTYKNTLYKLEDGKLYFWYKDNRSCWAPSYWRFEALGGLFTKVYKEDLVLLLITEETNFPDDLSEVPSRYE